MDETKIILPTTVLSKQICDECLNYLSVGPIVITRDNKTLCGRCSKSQTNPEELRRSLFNLVAEKCVFKCVNHFDGCDASLYFNEAFEHEEECSKPEQECYFCSFKGNSCQLVQHCLKDHPKKVARNGSFEIPLVLTDFECNFVSLQENQMFLVTVLLVDNMFYFAASNLISTLSDDRFSLILKHQDFYMKFDLQFIPKCDLYKRALENFLKVRFEKIVYYFSEAKHLRCSVVLEMEKKHKTEYNKNYLKKYLEVKQREIFLKEQVKLNDKKIQDLLIETENFALENTAHQKNNIFLQNFLRKFSILIFTCISCKKPITNGDILFCPESHPTCKKCLTGKCQSCNQRNFTNLKSLDNILVECKWAGCKESVNIKNYLLHNQNCKFRFYKCPLSTCLFVGSLDEFISHWHCKFPSLMVSDQIEFKLGTECEYYLIYDKELLHVTIGASGNVAVKEVNVLLPKQMNIEGEYYKVHNYCNGQTIDLRERRSFQKNGVTWSFNFFGNISPFKFILSRSS